ncbi:hypothetical protein TNCV_3539681 [Trichonephila clavipes]|nr:hypothetical protein TNCV_3539681 [Trichonephila clavipes]
MRDFPKYWIKLIAQRATLNCPEITVLSVTLLWEAEVISGENVETVKNYDVTQSSSGGGPSIRNVCVVCLQELSESPHDDGV